MDAVMTREVQFGDGTSGVVSLNTPVLRYPKNPVLTAHQVNSVWQEPHLQVMTVHNAGAVALADRTVLLFRSHLRCGVSVLGLATSADGVSGWEVRPRPVLSPATKGDQYAAGLDWQDIAEIESGGVEDARINPVGDTFAVTYSAYHAGIRNRVRVSLALTDDLIAFTRHGPMLDRDMRNVVLFPERIDGRYVGLFRPNDITAGDTGGAYTQIRIGYAEDFRTGPWEIADEPIMRTGAGPSAFSDKIGPGAPPVRTRHGWLNVFHGVRTTMDGNPYVLGVALHDLDDPRIVRMSSIPLLFPSRADCRVADTDYVHVPNVVFSCGLARRPDGTIVIYYAGNDTVMNVGLAHEDVLAELCQRYGQDPLTGRLLYDL
ncbi:glycoside hydrolase family 130 protein [Dactylosporangium darangshiense]